MPALNKAINHEIMLIYLADCRGKVTQLISKLKKTENTMVVYKKNDLVKILNDIYKIFHLIKCASDFFNFNIIFTIVESAETLVDQLRKGKILINIKIISLLLNICDLLTVIIDQFENSGTFIGFETEINYLNKKISLFLKPDYPGVDTFEHYIDENKLITGIYLNNEEWGNGIDLLSDIDIIRFIGSSSLYLGLFEDLVESLDEEQQRKIALKKMKNLLRVFYWNCKFSNQPILSKSVKLTLTRFNVISDAFTHEDFDNNNFFIHLVNVYRDALWNLSEYNKNENEITHFNDVITNHYK